jgi:hypothetical protein
MANDIVKFFGTQQGINQTLIDQLKHFAAGKQAMTGKALLKLNKAGVWVFGAANTVVRKGTKLIVNPPSLSSGFVAWHKSKVEAEFMQPIQLGPVPLDKLHAVEAKSGWQAQVSVEMMTMDEIPVQMLYKASSMGGQEVFFDLAGQLVFALSEDPRRAFPVIELSTTSYQHDEYGTVYKPAFSIVGWLGADGSEVTEQAKLGAGAKRGLV